jgi:hypothetical protein
MGYGGCSTMVGSGVLPMILMPAAAKGEVRPGEGVPALQPGCDDSRR